jgi:hypothetical protein
MLSLEKYGIALYSGVYSRSEYLENLEQKTPNAEISIEKNTAKRVTIAAWASRRVESSRVLRYDRRSVGQSVLEQSTHLVLMIRFLLLSDSCVFLDVGRSL